MGIYETPVEMVWRHVVEGEKHLAAQMMLIERLRGKALPTEGAHALLESFYVSQAQHEEHLRRLMREQTLSLRDEQRNLLPRRW
ncbi:hypothetical protein CO657_36135 (plasmid) [Rhizobium acidisoli]|uniref:Uncharacterized protein n=1 Tax=Rhizobium acidisoli TaxID=1538158 RepID=A0AAE5WV70_9HYPH|nr:hypothetical protein AOG23_29730 [Rhizobium acidisoli]QAS83195.1 hypothetical protein CO657_36135 [Rhizobium acidisoli]